MSQSLVELTTSVVQLATARLIAMTTIISITITAVLLLA